MNPLTNVKNINKLNEIELSTGSIHKKSWHDMYKGSAWIFIGGLEYGLTEGDVITVFSQYGEVVNINLVRDKKSGKSKGYCFLCFANQKSTVLAVDNLNGIKICNRTIRVDHVADYKPPKENERDDEITKMLKSEGCAPKPTLPNEESVASNLDVQIKRKKLKKEKKKKKKRKRESDGNNSGNDDSSFPNVEVKKERHDAGYDKYDTSSNAYRAERRSGLEDSGSDGRAKSRDQGVLERRNRQESEFEDKQRTKEKSLLESKHRQKRKEFRKDDEARSSKRERRGSSSEESSRKYRDEARRGKERKKSESKHSDSRRREKYSSSSSSDRDSSSSSASEDERKRTENRSSERDRPRSHNKTKKRVELDGRPVDQSDSNASASSKKRYEARERDYEYNVKDKYRNNDRRDSHYRDSYSKDKYDKR